MTGELIISYDNSSEVLNERQRYLRTIAIVNKFLDDYLKPWLKE